MADRPETDTYPHSDDDAHAAPNRRSPTGTPLWVKVAGIVFAIAVLLLIITLHLTGIMGPHLHG